MPKTKGITGAQLYYISRVCPENVTTIEAEDVEEWKCKTQDDKDFYEAGSQVVNDLILSANENDKPEPHQFNKEDYKIREKGVIIPRP